VRSRNDYFKLFLRTRLHVDSYNYFGPGVPDGTLKSPVLLRRARIELGGELMGNWQWELQGEFGSTAFSNAKGTTQEYAAPVGTDPTAETPRYATVQGAQYTARPIHAYVNYRASPLLNIQVGQFNLPFTMDNRTSTNQITFMERSFTARSWGTPTTKDMGVMLWGATRGNVLYYSAGVFQGEGENRPNADNRGLTAMRVYTRPLANDDGPLSGLQVGGSFKYGMHDKNYVGYDYPTMTTQGGYRFWSSTYTDGVGSGRLVHIIPSGAQLGVAGEFRVPVDRFDLRGELVYLKSNTREGVDGYQLTNTERFGTLKGYAYYVSLSYWLWGKPFLTGNPGDQKPPTLDLTKPDPDTPPQAVELAVRWEQLSANYESAARSGAPDSRNVDGHIKANFLSAGVNYWASQHLRLTLNYALNMFPDSGPKSASSSGGSTWSEDNRAQAPGNQLAKAINDDARDDAHVLHEVMARVAVAF
jgi:phosphate-selective porin